MRTAQRHLAETPSVTHPDPLRSVPSRLALGTAQLTGGYGLAPAPRPTPAEVAAILNAARAARIDTIDTAASYGAAEELLGAAGIADFQVITKLPPETGPDDVETQLARSLERLRVDRLSAVLVHRFEPGTRMLELLATLASDRRVGRVGASLYHPSELEWLVAHAASIDVVQIPFSVLDQRFFGLLEDTNARGIEVHARSIFLQGLLLLDGERVPASLQAARPLLLRLRELADAVGIGLVPLLVGFVLAHAAFDRVVVGVESAAQVRELANASAASSRLEALMPELRELALRDEKLIVPSTWSV